MTFYSGNRVEWVLSDLACSSNSITSTALYDTLGHDASKYILKSTESPVIISSKEHIRGLIDLKKEDPQGLASIILIVSMEPLTQKDQHLVDFAESNNIKLYDFSQVERTGAIFPHKECPPNSETVLQSPSPQVPLVQTPREFFTTKMLCFSNNWLQCISPHHKGTKEFAFLPLAHIFERHMLSAMFLFGGSVAFPRLGGTPLTLFEDLKLWKPTFMANVPRIFTKIEAGIKATTIDSTSSVTRSLYNRAIETKRSRQIKDGESGDHFVYDQLLIKKLRKAIGLTIWNFALLAVLQFLQTLSSFESKFGYWFCSRLR